jgi:hypothetical protein
MCESTVLYVYRSERQGTQPLTEEHAGHPVPMRPVKRDILLLHG